MPTKGIKQAKPDFLDLDKDGDKKEPMKNAAPKQKSKKREEQDLSRNAIADSKSKNKSIKKDGEYEAREAIKLASGEGPGMYNKGPKMMDEGGAYMESNAQEKSNLMNDNPIAAHASGSWMSKHARR